MTPKEDTMTDVEALYRAMCALDSDDPGVFNIVAISEPDTRPVAKALVAALIASGYSLVPTEELAALRAVEEAARDADPTPGQAITSAPAIAALRAALEAKGPRT